MATVKVTLSAPLRAGFTRVVKSPGVSRIVGINGATVTIDGPTGRMVQSSLSPLSDADLSALDKAGTRTVSLDITRQGPKGSRRTDAGWGFLDAPKAPRKPRQPRAAKVTATGTASADN